MYNNFILESSGVILIVTGNKSTYKTTYGEDCINTGQDQPLGESDQHLVCCRDLNVSSCRCANSMGQDQTTHLGAA